MTRVSEALAKAAQSRASGAVPEEGPRPLPADVPADLWPIEAATDSPADLWPIETTGNSPADMVELASDDQDGFDEPGVEPDARALLREADVQYGKLVALGPMQPTSVEQYRRLAARLHLAQAEHGTRVVMVTSAVASEGKTLTATNLALTLSESYKRRVLLIDADLRRPWVHELFKIPNVTGLNDGIRADVDRKVPVIRISEFLSVLTAGRPDPDPMSVLASDRMRRILADASTSFDWVIVDTPPVAVLSDAHLLARLVDTVVMVVRAGSTQHPAMTRAIEAVGRDRILGVVLNCVDESPQSAYQYYGYAARTADVGD